jgi:hypothetical protein
MTTPILTNKEGELYAWQKPEEPSIAKTDSYASKIEWGQYYEDLRSAKAEAVKVVNPETFFYKAIGGWQLNEFSESCIDPGEDLPLPSGLGVEILESLPPKAKIVKVEPIKEESQEVSKFTWSKIGSHHWSATLLSYIMRVGEYLESHEKEGNANREHYASWGEAIRERAKEINNYIQSLPDKE